MSNEAAEFLPTGFSRRGGELFVETVAARQLAERYGTPLYAYSCAHMGAQWSTLSEAFADLGPTICYAVKANDNLGILREFCKRGSGFDIVSVGELERALSAGAEPARIVFSGIGKRDDEIERALAVGVGTLNIESLAEGERIAAIAERRGQRARVAIRVNPDVDPRTHPYIATGLEKSKFGVPHAAVVELATTLAARPGIELVGLAFHLGSQMLDLAPVLDGLDRVLRIADELARSGFHLRQLDIGGGIGIRYAASQVDPNLPAFAGGVAARLRGRTLSLLLEPGRFLVGNAGVLLTRVLYPKVMGARRLWVVDAAMNDLLRPALYQARHEVVAARAGAGLEDPVEIVGPVCESTDVLASDRRLPRLAAGDVLAVLGAGAYGSVMASNYNSRPRPAEVLVDGNRVAVLRPRETLADLIARDAVDLEWCTL